MKKSHLFSYLLVLLVFLSGSRHSLRAADEVMQQIPERALAYLVVKNLQRLSQDIDRAAQRMQLPAPALLPMAKQRLQLTKGIAEDGDLAVVLMGRDAGSPFPVILVRASNYDELIGQLQGEPADGPIRQVSVAGSPVLVARKGAYAVFTGPPFREGLEQLLQSSTSVTVDEATQALADKVDVFAVVPQGGVRLLSQQALGGLQIIKQQLSQAGPQAEAVLAGLGVYEELFKWSADEVSQLAVGLDLADQGAIALTKRVSLQNPLEYTAPDRGKTALEQLAELPPWPYVVAFAGQLGGLTAMEKYMEWSMTMMQGMSGSPQLTEEQMQKLKEVASKSMEGVRGMSFVMGTPEAGGSIYSRMGMIMEVEDAQTYVTNYLEVTQQLGEIFGNNEKNPYRILSAERAPVAGVQGMKVVMQVSPDALGAGGPQLKEQFEKLYGKEGKIAFFVAPIDAGRVAIAYETEERLGEMIEAAKTSGRGLAAAEEFRATEQLLPKDALLAGYFSPAGTVQLAQRMIGMFAPAGQQPQIPPFPTSPPLGFSLGYDGRTLEARLVVAPQTLSAAGRYIQTVHQAPRP